MYKMKRMCMALVTAFVVLFGGVFSFLGINNVKAKALHEDYYGQNNTIYYFSDYYPTLSNIELSPAFSGYTLFYDVQRVDAGEFESMVDANYFSGFGDYCTFILDIKMFALDSSVLSDLFSSLKSEGCFTVLMMSSLAASGIDNWSFADNVDISWNVDFSELEIFAEDIVTRQCGTNPNYGLTTGNGSLHNTTFLFDNILDDPAGSASLGLDYLQEISPFFDYFIPELLENVDPDPDLEYADYEEMFTLLGIRFLAHTTGDYFVDLITGIPEEINSFSYTPGEIQDYVVVGFSDLSYETYGKIEAFQSQGNPMLREYEFPVHILEAETIEFGSGGIVASVSTGGSGNGSMSAFIDALQALLRNN